MKSNVYQYFDLARVNMDIIENMNTDNKKGSDVSVQAD